MSGLRWGFISGSIALVISVMLGIIFGVGAFHVFMRAVIFSIVFFGIGLGLHTLINSFIPELLYADDGNDSQMTFEQPGSRIDITLGSSGEYAVPELYKDSSDANELGNIEDLVSGAFKPPRQAAAAAPDDMDWLSPQAGIDRRREDDYNNEGESQNSADGDSFQFSDSAQSGNAPFHKPVFTPSFGDDSADGLGGLPDLDAMAMAFSSGFGSEPAPAAPSQPFEEPEAAPRYNKGNKPQSLKGDFNPKELAEGIRTVLSKDK